MCHLCAQENQLLPNVWSPLLVRFRARTQRVSALALTPDGSQFLQRTGTVVEQGLGPGSVPLGLGSFCCKQSQPRSLGWRRPLCLLQGTFFRPATTYLFQKPADAEFLQEFLSCSEHRDLRPGAKTREPTNQGSPIQIITNVAEDKSHGLCVKFPVISSHRFSASALGLSRSVGTWENRKPTSSLYSRQGTAPHLWMAEILVGVITSNFGMKSP